MTIPMVKLTDEQVEAIRFGYSGGRFKDSREDYELVMDCMEIDNEDIREKNQIRYKNSKRMFLGLNRVKYTPLPLYANPWKWIKQQEDCVEYHLGDQCFTKEGVLEMLQTSEDLKLLCRIGRVIYKGDNHHFLVSLGDMNTILRYMEDQDRYLM